MTSGLPIIDMTADETTLAGRVGDAARNIGFFYLSGHGIDPALTRPMAFAPARVDAPPATGS